jgi:hypothetical protein
VIDVTEGEKDDENERGPSLSLDDRAVALFTRWSKEQREGRRNKITVTALAAELKTNRTQLYDRKTCPTFVILWASYREKIRPGSKGRRKARPFRDDD